MADVLVILIAAAWPALLVAGAAVGLVWWALFADKPRGRRRCPNCWHDLSGTPGLTCGECGRTARDEREFGRTRRRWWLAAGTLVGTAAVLVFAQLSILDATWPAALPDAILVRIPAFAPVAELPGAVRRELGVRVETGGLDGDELLALARTVSAHGPVGSSRDPAAAILDAIAWAVPQEFAPRRGLRPSEDGERAAALAAWQKARDALLRTLPPWTEVTPPVRWPRGEPAAVLVRATVWGGAEWRVRPRGSTGTWLVGAGIAGLRSQPGPAPVEVGPVGEDGRLRGELEFEIRRAGAAPESWGPWTPVGALAFDGAVATLDAASIEPTEDAVLDDRVRQCFDTPITLWSDPARPVAFRMDLGQLAGDGEQPITFGMTVELLEGSTVRRKLEVGWDSSGAAAQWVLAVEDARALSALRAIAEGAPPGPEGLRERRIPGWTMRIRPSRFASLAVLGRGPRPGETLPVRTWGGEVSMPLEAVPSPESAPPRSFRLGFSDETHPNGANR